MERVIYKITRATFGCVMGIIILLILFFQSTEYYCKNDFLLSNIQILVILIGVFLTCTILYYVFSKKDSVIRCSKKIDYDKLTLYLTVILCLGQVYVFYNIFFLTGWDVETIRNSASQLAIGNNDVLLSCEHYYSTYPNNLFITYLNAFVLKLNKDIGVFTGEYAMMSCVFVNCIINSSACYLVYKTATLFVEKKFAFIGYCLVVLSIGVSPWTVIFYSDAVGLIIPILSFYLYVKSVSNKILRYICRFTSIMLSVMGYYIKPQCAIMLIAIIIIEIVHLLTYFNLKKILRFTMLIVSCFFCFLVITFTIDWCSRRAGLVVNDNKTFGAAHFLMMGLNESRGGGYSQDDVNYSHSFETAEERKNANLEKVVERLEDLRVSGYIKHIGRKMLTAFNDGTFAWSKEGGFYSEVPGDLNSRMASFLKSIYYNNGTRYHYFLIFEQIIWVIILLFAFASSIFKVHDMRSKTINILWLSILGLILYEILFEVRARYIYIYVPIFSLLAIYGIKGVIMYCKFKIDRTCSKKAV